MSDVEIEIKTRVEGADKLEAFLEKHAENTGEKYQKDEYFVPPHRNFLVNEPVEEWLRLRTSDKNVITYKKWHYDKDGRSHHSDEYETTIGDVDQLKKIFSVLDFKPVATVEKKRRTWLHGDYEVSIDSVTNLGDFVEVEFKGDVSDDPDPKRIAHDMVEFLRSAGCTKIERNYVGYPFMVLFPDKVTFEEV